MCTFNVLILFREKQTYLNQYWSKCNISTFYPVLHAFPRSTGKSVAKLTAAVGLKWHVERSFIKKWYINYGHIKCTYRVCTKGVFHMHASFAYIQCVRYKCFKKGCSIRGVCIAGIAHIKCTKSVYI